MPAFRFIAVVICMILLGCVSEKKSDPPNIVVVLVDDMRWDEYGAAGHSFIKTPNIDRIAAEGITFKNAFATTPLCSPSRASFLTGQYAHTNGITDNTARNEQSHKLNTFPKMLRDAGYETAFMGKWHMGNDDSPRPGFDQWVSLKGQGEAIDPQFNINGEQKMISGYVTDILTEYALAFINKEREKNLSCFTCRIKRFTPMCISVMMAVWTRWLKVDLLLPRDIQECMPTKVLTDAPTTAYHPSTNLR
jgi:hypothetical protein